MESAEREVCGLSFRLLSTATAGLFAGGALYVDVVDHPARMTHDLASALAMFKESIVRSRKWQPKLALTSGLSGVLASCCFYGTRAKCWCWLVAGGAMLSLYPFTAWFMRPLNAELLDAEADIDDRGDLLIAQKLSRWSCLHSVRTFVSLASFSCMIYLLSHT